MIEILIVVVILGILAAIVVPQMSGAAQAARESTLKDAVRYLRGQVKVYRAQHRDIAPGFPGGDSLATPTASDFVEQMTQYSDENSVTHNTATDRFKFGPYLSKMPANPMSNLDTITVIAAGDPIPAADNSTGWFYKPDTMEVVPNTTGTDSAGEAFSSY